MLVYLSIDYAVNVPANSLWLSTGLALPLPPWCEFVQFAKATAQTHANVLLCLHIYLCYGMVETGAHLIAYDGTIKYTYEIYVA